jgi:hypothetical protein
MKGLIIKEPWITLILNGQKTLELRSTRTKNLGRIALLNDGKIRGYATLVRWDGPLSKQQLLSRVSEHCIPAAMINDPNFSYQFGWVLSNVQILSPPCKYTHPLGAQIWVTDVHKRVP